MEILGADYLWFVVDAWAEEQDYEGGDVEADVCSAAVGEGELCADQDCRR